MTSTRPYPDELAPPACRSNQRGTRGVECAVAMTRRANPTLLAATIVTLNVALAACGGHSHNSVPTSTTTGVVPTSSTLPPTTGLAVLPPKRACTTADLASARPALPPVPHRLSQPVTLGGFPLLPVPATLTPPISGQQAWRTVAPTLTTAGSHVEIFLATDNATVPARRLPDGSLSPLYKGDLVWVVHASHIPLNSGQLGHGGPTTVGSAPATTQPRPPCVFYDLTSLVNATTGVPLNAEGQGTY